MFIRCTYILPKSILQVKYRCVISFSILFKLLFFFSDRVVMRVKDNLKFKAYQIISSLQQYFLLGNAIFKGNSRSQCLSKPKCCWNEPKDGHALICVSDFEYLLRNDHLHCRYCFVYKTDLPTPWVIIDFFRISFIIISGCKLS